MYKKSHFDEKKVLYKVIKLVKKIFGLFDPTRPGPLTLGLNSARPETSQANFGRPGLEPGRCGPYVLEPGPSRAKKSPSRIGPAREQHYFFLNSFVFFAVMLNKPSIFLIVKVGSKPLYFA